MFQSGGEAESTVKGHMPLYILLILLVAKKKGSALIHRDRTSQIKMFPFPFDFDGVFYRCRKSFLVCVFLTCCSVVAHENSDFQAHPPERCCLFFLVMQNFQVLIEKKKSMKSNWDI